MLGMMNCPTSDNMDFYASSPTAIRQVSSGGNLPKLADQLLEDDEPVIESLQKRSGSNPFEVFTAISQRPIISYTEDGRRLIDGKLENGHGKPEKKWSRIIVDSVTANKLCRQKSISQGHLPANFSGEHDGLALQNGENAGLRELKAKQKRRFSFGSKFPFLLVKKSTTGTKPVQRQQ